MQAVDRDSLVDVVCHGAVVEALGQRDHLLGYESQQGKAHSWTVSPILFGTPRAGGRNSERIWATGMPAPGLDPDQRNHSRRE